jgi:hypothetical protein
MFSDLGDFPAPIDSGVDRRSTRTDAGHDSGHDGTTMKEPDAAADGHVDAPHDAPARVEADAAGSPADCAASTIEDAGAPDVAVEPAFYISPSGTEGGTGTIDDPFATLDQAQAAMRGGAVKTTYLRAGHYAPVGHDAGSAGSKGITLTSGDDGEKWSYYPPDGVGSADITGGSTTTNAGLSDVFNVGANNVTITGLTIHNFAYAAVAANGSDSLTVTNNIIYSGFNHGIGNPAGITCYGCDQATFSHNVIHDIAAFGISMTNAEGAISMLHIDGNVIYNTCMVVTNCGAIYLEDRNALSVGLSVTNNYVHDGNLSASLDSGAGCAVYAASCASQLTVSGNVFAGKNGALTVFVQGGNAVQIHDNVTDLGDSGAVVADFLADAGCPIQASGNVYRNNIVIAKGRGGGFLPEQASGSPVATIESNDYYDYVDASVGYGTGVYKDTDPSTANPKLSGRTYSLACGSPVRGGPVSFPPLVGGWGPPGYVLPDSGTPPSCPF